MGENSLKWSCDNSKFLKVLSWKGEYREKLGCKFNSAWHLSIIPDKTNLNDEGGYDPEWWVFLEREHTIKPIAVIASLISNASVHFVRELNFDTGKAEKEVGHLELKHFQNCLPLHIVFIFEQECENPPEEDTLVKTSNLGIDLLTLYHSKYMVDVTLQCGSDVEYAHKAVLGARSPVFKAMFGNEMQEKEKSSVTIKDMDISVLRALMEFVYGDEVKITSAPFACDLLDAAERYQVQRLKEVCLQYLETALSTENAVKLLEVANLYDDQFKAFVISYIADNFDDLKHSEEWVSLKSRNPVLALEVYSYIDQ